MAVMMNSGMRYIPLYVAATYAMTYYEDHKIKPIYVDMPFATDTIMINKNMHEKVPL